MKKPLKIYNVPSITSLQDMVIQTSQRYGDKLALEDLNDTPIPRVTYSAMMKQILKFGTALRNLGIKERSHIAVIGENRVQWALSYLTMTCFNYVVVPIDRNLSQNEILNVIHESDAEAVIFSAQYEQIFTESHSSLRKVSHYISMDSIARNGKFFSMSELVLNARGCTVEELPKVDPKEMSVIIFTSGTLGRAKGVMLSQWNIASNLMAMLSVFPMYPADRFLSVLPMHHTYECNCGLLCPLFAGSSIHFARSLKTVVDDLQRVKATILLGVPLLYDKMFKRIHKGIQEKRTVAKILNPLIKVTDVLQTVGWKGAKKSIFKELHHKFGGSIRYFIAGGAAPDPLVAKGLRDLGFNFIQGYGLTETSPILALNSPTNLKDDAAGIPLPGTELKINAPDNDGIGEVFAKGPNVMLGYYKNPSATTDVMENGWFKTGDLGYFDEEGFLHISGRKKNVIISKSGKNVFPEEIEDVLNRSPFILESLVYGGDDPKLDEIIAAQIVVDAEAVIELSERTGREITKEFLHQIIADEVAKTNKQLSGYKQIRKFVIRDQEFQKTTTQKIKRFANLAPQPVEE
ncbi:MAG: AMP-binding protein [Ignavibacteriales bacterium]|nr:AMP-binding protein [Ignavibacteriales bacterium]